MDPACKMNYASFYILGLKELFGKKAHFSTLHFPNLSEREQCFLFVAETDNGLFKVAIDFHDSRNVEIDSLKWADIYAKINLNDLSYEGLSLKLGDDFLRHKDKIISIPPSFGIRIFTVLETLSHIVYLVLNFWKSKKLKIYIADVLRMYIKRLPLKSYKPAKHKSNYVFFVASIWAEATCYINITRSYFIRACKRTKGIRFEGGFVNIGYECEYIEDLQFLMFQQEKIPLNEFISKTKESVFVFNNPSVGYCHGWKLAEYLCMGKAIISIPLSNELPVDLIHEENIYFADDNENSIFNSIQNLLSRPELIDSLERNAEKYWSKHAAPSAVIKRLLSQL